MATRPTIPMPNFVNQNRVEFVDRAMSKHPMGYDKNTLDPVVLSAFLYEKEIVMCYLFIDSLVVVV